MEFLVAYWMPILVSAVLVFVASSVIHMATSIHAGDYRKLAHEDAVLEAIRSSGNLPGQYMFPGCESKKEMNSPEHMEKFQRGPCGLIIIMPPGGFQMGKSLLYWFLLLVGTGAFVAYVLHHATSPGAAYLHVFRVAGATAVMMHCLGSVHDSIWKGVSWKITAKFVLLDGILYSLLTAGVFAWLRP